MPQQKIGLARLAAKALAVITASLHTLSGGTASAQAQTAPPKKDNEPSIDASKSKVPKLVLKPNKSLDGVLLAMHSSHRSHSSHSSHYSGSSSGHASHTSHSSHASHYSGSPSYKPSASNTVPYPSPAPKVPLSVPAPVLRLKTPSTSTAYPRITVVPPDTSEIPRRVLKKGCQGEDVTELQQLLAQLLYDVVITGYFGDKTEAAVKEFQQSNELKPDGIVGPQTFYFIQTKAQ